jgi:hypothetical protein
MMSVIRNEIIDHKENRIFQKKRQKLMNKTERQIKEQTTIDDFVAGALTSMGILFEFVGFYNNNHQISLKQRKQELFMRKN